MSGVTTNLAFLRALTASDAVRSGRYDTTFIERELESLLESHRGTSVEPLMLASAFAVSAGLRGETCGAFCRCAALARSTYDVSCGSSDPEPSASLPFLSRGGTGLAEFHVGLGLSIADRDLFLPRLIGLVSCGFAAAFPLKPSGLYHPTRAQTFRYSSTNSQSAISCFFSMTESSAANSACQCSRLPGSRRRRLRATRLAARRSGRARSDPAERSRRSPCLRASERCVPAS